MTKKFLSVPLFSYNLKKIFKKYVSYRTILNFLAKFKTTLGSMLIAVLRACTSPDVSPRWLLQQAGLAPSRSKCCSGETHFSRRPSVLLADGARLSLIVNIDHSNHNGGLMLGIVFVILLTNRQGNKVMIGD